MLFVQIRNKTTMAQGLYTYRDPSTGKEFGYGIPEINRQAIEGQKLEFVSGPTGAETDPLAKLRESEQAQTQAPITRYTSPGTEAPALFPAVDRTFGAVDEEKIRETERKRVQSAIDAINESIAGELTRARELGVQRLGRTRAMGAAFGLTGSPTGEAQTIETERLNLAEEREIEAKRRNLIETALGRADDRAAKEIIARRQLAQTNQEKYLEFLSGQKEEARKDIELLAKTGAKIEQNTDVYNRLMKQSGYDPLTFDSILNYYKSEKEKIKYENVFDKDTGTLILFGIDPKTQEPVFKKYQTDIAAGETYKEIDGVPYAMKKDEKGNVSLRKLEGFAPSAKKGLEEEKLRKEIEKLELEVETKAKKEEIAGTAGGPPKTQKTLDQLNFLTTTLNEAKNLAGASGRSGARKKFEAWFVGSTDYTNLVAKTNTLRTNVLTLATDPGIKKFFGPQMSEADVELMTSAGTTLNPELQRPEELKTELTRLEDWINRARMAVANGLQQEKSGQKTNIETLAAQKGFDLAKARASGYSDDEILNFLNQ